MLAGAPKSPPVAGLLPKPPNAGGLAAAAEPGVPNAKPLLAPNAPVLVAGVEAAPKGLEPAAAAATAAAASVSACHDGGVMRSQPSRSHVMFHSRQTHKHAAKLYAAMQRQDAGPSPGVPNAGVLVPRMGLQQRAQRQTS